MKRPEKDYFLKRLAAFEILSFVLLIILLWLDEILDIPYLLFAAEQTPINWREALFETILIVPICLMIVYYTRKLFKRLKYLEGFLSICASCKKVRNDEGNWQQLELYISERSDAEFSHGICPECAARLYPEVFKDTHGDKDNSAKKDGAA